jgi:hypothetical protein
MGAKKGIAAILLITQAGCMTMRVVDSPSTYVEARAPGEVLITRSDGRQIPLESPKIVSDTVFGFSMISGDETAIPVVDIRQMKARQLSPFRTALFAGGMAAVTIGLAMMVLGSPDYQGEPEPDDDGDNAVVPVLLRIPIAIGRR